MNFLCVKIIYKTVLMYVGCGKLMGAQDSWWILWAAQRHHGKKGRLERGSKVVHTTNNLAGQEVEGRLEGGMASASTALPLSNLHSPSPASCFTMSICPHIGLPLSHHNQLCPLKLTVPHKTFLLSLDVWHSSCLGGLLKMGQIPCPNTSETNYLRRVIDK